MTTLTQPSPELVAKILSELGSDECLGGYKISAMGGNAFYPLYSFEAAVNFLYADSYDLLSAFGNKGSIGYIDPGVLGRWVAEVFQDQELAEAIDRETARRENYADQVEPIRVLMAERLQQCLAVVEKEPPEEDQLTPT